MNYSTIVIIYNPNSTGSGKVMARELASQIRKRLPRQKVKLMKTAHAGHGEELAYTVARSEKNSLVISASGDGGYNDVINGAMKALQEGWTVTTGLLPAGNANDHYHNLHQDDLIEKIVSTTTTRIDVLKLEGTVGGKPVTRYAHSYIGLGFTPLIGEELNKTSLNRFKETWIVARSLFTIKPVRLRIGPKARYYESVVFSNVDRMSKYLQISQPSSVTDGKFEVTIFRRRNKFQLIMVLLKATIGKVEEDHQVSEFSLSTINKTPVQMDGEIITLDPRTDVRITIERQALPCVV